MTKITENLLGNKEIAAVLQLPTNYVLGPGPWFAVPGPHGEPLAIFACEGDKIKFEVLPDLLEAAEAIVRRLDNGDSIEPGWYEAEELRAAIAKATDEVKAEGK